jgi:hypothetical protein
MQIQCEKCGCIGINFPRKWAHEEAKQHRAKHRALGVNGHHGDVRVKVEKDGDIGALAMFTLPRR